MTVVFISVHMLSYFKLCPTKGVKTLICVGLFSEDCTLQSLISSALSNEFQFFSESDEAGIRQLITEQNCRVMILDLNSNHDFLKERIACARRMISPDVAWVIMADDGLRSTANELVRHGAFGYCRRPPSVRDLRTMLQRAYQSSAPAERFEDAPSFPRGGEDQHRIVGSSPRMQHVHHLIERVANIEASVLVTGESGTGKELVARAIHNRGSRRNRPFVAVACGAIPETLIEAELFGHEKGAFTGTVGAREGFFEQAGDGTLFLDEIGELSPYTQVKLLRVLQQREFSRLGSNRLIPLRARIVLATHRDLEAMVAQGKFRQDLYYRINVMSIETPSLQERPEDIPQIALHFLHRYAQVFQKPMDAIDSDAMEALQNYAWPGNVRELENAIQRAIILAPSKRMRLQDLPTALQEESPISVDEDCGLQGTFEKQLSDCKIRLAVSAVREHNGNKALAARSLNISRSYLYRLIRQAENGSMFETTSLEEEGEDCPTSPIPVIVRQGGMTGTWNGARKEAFS